MLHFPLALRRTLICLGLALLPSAARAVEPDPLDADAATPALTYDSVLRTYQPFHPQPAQGWREANDEVGRIGGWRTYAQEPWETSAASDEKDEPSHGSHAHGEQP
ncbi:MAG: hypothetical protein V4812_17915 [Pseudomonadota bacterium]